MSQPERKGHNPNMLSEAQRTALEYAASEEGGWPRSKETALYRTIRSYRVLASRGLVVETGKTKVERGSERKQFIATAAGRSLLS